MRRATLIVLCALAGLACAASTAAAGSSPRAKLGTCGTALAKADRYVVFVGKMKSLRRGNRMMMRFDLYSRTAESSPEWVRVEAPDLGIWHRASPGVPSYTFRQRVQGLPAPARYRALITFRWKGPKGAKGKRTVVVKKSTPVCSQPDLRPDLRVSFDSFQPAGDGLADYTLRVRNAGKTAAGSFAVALAVAGETQSAFVAALGPGGDALVTVRASRCDADSPASATVDPDGTVAESKEGNNTATRTCMGKRAS
jgi:hypothetical protein